MKKVNLKGGGIEYVKDAEEKSVGKENKKIPKNIKAKDLSDKQVRELVYALSKKNNLI